MDKAVILEQLKANVEEELRILAPDDVEIFEDRHGNPVWAELHITATLDLEED